MKNNYFIFTFVSLLTVFLFLSSTPILAVTATPSSKLKNKLPVATKQAASQKIMALKKTNADKEIDRRVKSLNLLLVKITGIKRLSETQKTELTREVQDYIKSMTDLKAKIDADTDAATLVTDKKSIVDSYRVYAVFMPKIVMAAQLDAALSLIDDMNAQNITIEEKIKTASEAGKKVTALETTLADRKTKLADAAAKAQPAIISALTLTAEGYPDNKATITGIRDSLKEIRANLKAAQLDLITINKGLKTVR
jgi:hypothetical protein